MVPWVAVSKGTFSYEVAGSGPCVLVPRCNFPWTDFDLDRLEHDFTVLTVSPLGFGEGGRLSQTDGYSADTLAADLLAACSDAGFNHFSVFGYSFTGAVSAWLAHVSDRVDAVVSGGFPLAADYRRHLATVERNNPEAETRPDDDGVESDFDLPAARAFYKRIATLQPAGLLDNLPARLFTFWGGADEVIEESVGLDAQASAFVARGLACRVFDGLTHGGMLQHLDLVLPEVIEWLNGDVDVAQQDIPR